jgi:predicted acyl esterase
MLTRGQTMVRSPDGSRAVEIGLAHAGYRVLPGRRLRLQLASSDFPLFLPHPGTDDDPWRAVAERPSEQTLRVGGASNPYLSLTIAASK